MKLAAYRHRNERQHDIVDSDNKCGYQAASCVTDAADVRSGWIKHFRTAGPFVLLLITDGLLRDRTPLGVSIPRRGCNILCVGKIILACAKEASRSGFGRCGLCRSVDAHRAPIVLTKEHSSTVDRGRSIGHGSGTREQAKGGRWGRARGDGKVRRLQDSGCGCVSTPFLLRDHERHHCLRPLRQPSASSSTRRANRDFGWSRLTISNRKT